MFLNLPMTAPAEIYVIANAGGNGEAETRASSVVSIVSDHGVLTVFTSPEILHNYKVGLLLGRRPHPASRLRAGPVQAGDRSRQA